jgi:hypothetical protein
MYALSGLYLTDHEQFLERAPAYSSNTDTVFVQTGCIGAHQQAGELVAMIAEGEIPRQLQADR